MKTDELLVPPGRGVRLADRDPRATLPFEKKKNARGKLESDLVRLEELQDVFAAARSHALLIVLTPKPSMSTDSKRRPMKKSRTIFSGAVRGCCPSAAGS